MLPAMSRTEDDLHFLLRNGGKLWHLSMEEIGVLPDWPGEEWDDPGWFAHGQRAAAAIHEAGHAAMALRLGARPTEAALGPIDGTGIVFWRQGVAAAGTRTDAMIHLAGLAAELLAGSQAPYGGARVDLLQAAIACGWSPATAPPLRAANPARLLEDFWLETVEAMEGADMEQAVRTLALPLLRDRRPGPVAWTDACRIAMTDIWLADQQELPLFLQPPKRQRPPRRRRSPHAAQPLRPPGPPPSPPPPAAEPTPSPPPRAQSRWPAWRRTLIDTLAMTWAMWLPLLILLLSLLD